MRRATRAAALGLLTVGGLVLVPAGAASAHPLGNFTINQFSGLRLSPGEVQIDLVTDMAEIPTFQLRGDIDTNHDGHVDATEATRWRAHQCAAQANKLSLQVDGRAIPVRVGPSGSLSFPPGQAGLDTLRLECTLTATFPDTGAPIVPHSLSYVDANYDGRLGWREINAIDEGGATLLTSNVPTTSVSDRLRKYPADLLRSPLAQRTAALRVAFAASAATSLPAPQAAATPASLPASILPRGVDQATRAFTALVARQRLSVAFVMVAVALAVLLGAIHALAPGHGKTVMAAYLVGQRGSLRQAALIGLTVTITHTAGVLALGIVLTTTTAIAPERLYPWLGVASGLLLASIGASMLVRARRGRQLLVDPAVVVAAPAPVQERMLVGAGVQGISDAPERMHSHDHRDHSYDHHDPTHNHDDHTHVHSHGGRAHSHTTIDPNRPLGWRSLVAMGFAGGLVPSPSALVVLLGAIALGRAWFGLVLVLAYGLGMAATLTGAGLLLVRARGFIDRRAARKDGHLFALTRLLPTATSLVIVVLGLILAARGAAKI